MNYNFNPLKCILTCSMLVTILCALAKTICCSCWVPCLTDVIKVSGVISDVGISVSSWTWWCVPVVSGGRARWKDHLACEFQTSLGNIELPQKNKKQEQNKQHRKQSQLPLLLVHCSIGHWRGCVEGGLHMVESTSVSPLVAPLCPCTGSLLLDMRF